MLDGNIEGQLKSAHDVDQVSGDQQTTFEKYLIECSEIVEKIA